MWPWNKKARNRRLERTIELDVKGGSRFQQWRSGRLLAMALTVSLGTFLVLVLLWHACSMLWNRLVYENPVFAIQRLEITTDGVLAPEQIRRWARVNLGQNLLALDLSWVKRDLELVPVIKSAALERVLPNTLRIRISERVPVAQILCPAAPGSKESVVFTLDEHGVVMLPIPPHQRAVPWTSTNEFLPVLTGVSYAELRPGRAVESWQIKAALRMIQEFERSPMVGLVDLRWIDLSAPEVITVTTGTGAKVTLGADRFNWQFRRWRAIHDYERQRGCVVMTLDLSVANNVPYTAVQAGIMPPVPVRTTKTPERSIPRRKNA